MRIVIVLLIALVSSLVHAQENQVDLHFSKNMEFFGYLVELGDPAGNDPNHPISKIIYAHPENQSNPLLMEIFTIAADMDYTTLVSLMYYLPELPLEDSYELPVQRAKALGYESEEEVTILRNLLAKVNQFYQESNFDSICNALAPHRAEVLAHIRSHQPSAEQMSTMESFYQTDYMQYEVVPSLTIWSAGWGINNGIGHTATFILGPLSKSYDFSDTIRFMQLSVHEFGHSFVNHVVLPNQALLDQTSGLFENLKVNMTGQGYPDWESCMVEHFVRAGEVIIPELMGNTEGSEALLKDYVDDRQFIYLPFIIQQLKKYRLDEQHSYEEAVKKTLKDLEKTYVQK